MFVWIVANNSVERESGTVRRKRVLHIHYTHICMIHSTQPVPTTIAVASPYWCAQGARGAEVMSEFTRGFICGLHEKGEPVGTIAVKLGLSEAAVRAALTETEATRAASNAATGPNADGGNTAVSSPLSALYVADCLGRLRAAKLALRAVLGEVEALNISSIPASVGAFCEGVLAFLYPNGPPQTMEVLEEDVLDNDDLTRAVVKTLVDQRNVFLWNMSLFPDDGRLLLKATAVLLKRDAEFEHLGTLVLSLALSVSTDEEAGWVGYVVSLGGDNNSFSASNMSGDGVVRLRDALLRLCSKTTTRRSAQWAAAALRAAIGDATDVYATVEVREVLLRLALWTGEKAAWSATVERVSAALSMLTTSERGRRFLMCVAVRDALLSLAGDVLGVVTPAVAAHVVKLITEMAVAGENDDKGNDAHGTALREFFTDELLDVFLALAMRSADAPRWYEHVPVSLEILLVDRPRRCRPPRSHYMVKRFQTLKMRDALLQLLPHHLGGNFRLSTCLSYLPRDVLLSPVAATATVRDALLILGNSDGWRMMELMNGAIVDSQSQSLFGTMEVRDALVPLVSRFCELVTVLILKLITYHAANQSLFCCAAVRDAFVGCRFLCDSMIEVMICLLEGSTAHNATTLFGTTSVRDAIVSKTRRCNARLLLRLMTLLTAHDAANQALFATQAVLRLLLQVAEVDGGSHAAAVQEILGKLRHSVAVTFGGDGRAVVSGTHDTSLLAGVSKAAPMRTAFENAAVGCMHARLEEIALDGLERLAGSEGGFLRGAARLRRVTLEALEEWRVVGDGFLSGCMLLHVHL